MQVLMSNKTYDVLKWVCLVALPALSALYAVVARAWGWPHTAEIILTIDAVGVFIGALIGVSSAQYKRAHDVGR